MAIAEEASRQRRRTIQIALIFITLATLPCYCVGFLLLAARPAPTDRATPSATLPLGFLTATPITLTPIITLIPPVTATNPIFVPPTPTQSFFFPTATFSFPTPFIPSPTAQFPTVPVFPTLTPIIPPTSTPFFTNTPFFTITPIPTFTPTETPTVILFPPTETPTREIFPPTAAFETPTPDILPPPPTP